MTVKSGRPSLVKPALTFSHRDGVPEDDRMCGEAQHAFHRECIDAQCSSVIYTKPTLLGEGEVNVLPK